MNDDVEAEEMQKDEVGAAAPTGPQDQQQNEQKSDEKEGDQDMDRDAQPAPQLRERLEDLPSQEPPRRGRPGGSSALGPAPAGGAAAGCERVATCKAGLGTSKAQESVGCTERCTT